MVNWQDPQVIENWGAVLVNITFFMLGLYGWSYINSCQVESALLRHRVPFQWRMVPYLIGRIFFLVTLVLSVTSVAIPSHIDCYRVLRFLAFSGNIVVACTSTNLVIRTWTVWKTNRFVRLFMGLITLGHWFMIIFDSKEAQISSSPPTSEFCGFMIVNPTYSAATSLYTMILDFILLKLTIFGHWRSSSSSLFTIISTQGTFLYFIVLFASIVPVIFSLLNLNYLMNVFFVWPAICVMTIASSYAVIPTFIMPQSTNHRTPVGTVEEKPNL
ncbi:uncharacterized protein EDB93DRAFT_391524 [Suillus bovinus]|uniref:uncharacterized protein n=1 Tax=Suillus bovinus TaxID=48563 RepID=UPI001B868ED4|nr:uncharacterized protein EDB93DRAFT_391524 [Suillus bovinus]KAG2147847.1 hypothetical protein EDB93DRAFT_391524 [Suillus bovinus]